MLSRTNALRVTTQVIQKLHNRTLYAREPSQDSAHFDITENPLF